MRDLERCLRVLTCVAVLAVTSPATAYEEQLRAYTEALDRVCVAGVTPELRRLYEELVNALDAAGQGRGGASDFGGPRTPEHAYLDCVSVEPGE
jgi:hypothetical protein